MQDEIPLTPAERELEAALAALRPATPAMDRDGLMFRAGRASARNRVLPWRLATGALILALATLLTIRPEARTMERIVHVPAEQAGSEGLPALAVTSLTAPESGVAHRASYLRLRDIVLAEGPDALPPASAGAVNDSEGLLHLRRLRDVPSSSRRQWELFGLERLLPHGGQS